MFTIDNVPVCFYLGETMTEEVMVNGKSERHYFPAIVTAFQPGYSQTNWDYGSDFKFASKVVEDLNLKRGVNAKAASLIVATSMFPGSRISLDDIYAANGEAVPISVR
jgi:hypothetical protein